VFVLADRGSGEQYVIPAKAAIESTIRLLLADRQQESLTVYTDGFRAYEPLEEEDAFTREYVVHGDGEYVDGTVHVNTCESHIEASRKTDSHRISERFISAVRCSETRVKKRSKPSSKLRCESPTIYATRAFEVVVELVSVFRLSFGGCSTRLLITQSRLFHQPPTTGG
jgi:transposase-like protein